MWWGLLSVWHADGVLWYWMGPPGKLRSSTKGHKISNLICFIRCQPALPCALVTGSEAMDAPIAWPHAAVFLASSPRRAENWRSKKGISVRRITGRENRVIRNQDDWQMIGL